MTGVNLFTPSELVAVDEDYDHECSSDGRSRYGAYLAGRAHLFVDDDEPLDTAAFAVLAWEIANSPIMSPGYVRRRPDITAVTCRHADEPGLLVAGIEVRLPWPKGLRAAPALAGWQGWQRAYAWSDEPPSYVEPADDRPTLLPTVHLWVPIPHAALPTQRRRPAPGPVNTADAKRVVGAVCRHVNAIAGPVVRQLREAPR